MNEDKSNFDHSAIFVVGINNKQSEICILRINAKTGGIETMKRVALNSNFDPNL